MYQNLVIHLFTHLLLACNTCMIFRILAIDYFRCWKRYFQDVFHTLPFRFSYSQLSKSSPQVSSHSSHIEVDLNQYLKNIHFDWNFHHIIINKSDQHELVRNYVSTNLSPMFVFAPCNLFSSLTYYSSVFYIISLFMYLDYCRIFKSPYDISVARQFRIGCLHTENTIFPQHPFSSKISCSIKVYN